jgi:hypothetical protein
VFHGLGYKGNLGALVVTSPHHGGPNGHKPCLTARGVGRPAIFADGMLAPPVTSFIASKSFSRFIDATKAHDKTLVGGASFSGGIFLVAAVENKALKGSMVGERMYKIFGREVREKEMS